MEFPISLYSKDLTKLLEARPEVADEWVLLNRGWHQYAAGICGIDHWCAIVFMSFDRETFVAHGFDKKGDWRRFLDKDYIKSLTRYVAGSKDGTYGHVGRQVNNVKCVRFRDLISIFKNSSDPECKYFIDLKKLDPYHQYGFPRAIDGRKHMVNPVPPAEISVA